ncbi:MAG: carbohydrate ABC transporter permease [Chloroflexi bacterium]|nr:carbohydrate ABC transporter permease [Chloroflexota bacterium]
MRISVSQQQPRQIAFAEWGKHVVLMLVSAALLFPMFLMLVMSVKNKEQIVFEFFTIRPPFHFENYAVAYGFISPFMLNSVWMAVASTVLTVSVTALAGYAFGKLEFPGRNLLFWILFAKMMLPGIMNLIPSFTLAWRLGILDTSWPVILFCAGTSQPFWVFVMRTFVAQQPQELFESMRIDGANEFQIFRYLAVPLLRPMIALMSINVFVSVWNDYIWPLVTIQSFEKRPLTVGLAYLTSAHPGDYGMLTAGYVIAALPLLVLFFISMKQFIEGLTAGAIKL